jgi:hypothetical protein
MCTSILRKCRLQLSQALSCHTIPNPIVGIYQYLLLSFTPIFSLHGHLGFDGKDFGLEFASFLCGSSLLEGACGERILGFTGDAKVGCDVLGGDAHREETVLGERMSEDLVRIRGRNAAGAITHRHRFYAST